MGRAQEFLAEDLRITTDMGEQVTSACLYRF